MGKGLQKLSTVFKGQVGVTGVKNVKNFCFYGKCYSSYMLDSRVTWLRYITSLRPFTKLIDSYFDFGSFGVTGVKSSLSLKVLLLIQYTLYVHVTYAYKQAWEPLQNLLTQISIWGHLGSQGSKRSFSLKNAISLMWLMYMVHLETRYKSYYFKFWSKVIWGHRGEKVISNKSDRTRPCYIA